MPVDCAPHQVLSVSTDDCVLMPADCVSMPVDCAPHQVLSVSTTPCAKPRDGTSSSASVGVSLGMVDELMPRTVTRTFPEALSLPASEFLHGTDKDGTQAPELLRSILLDQREELRLKVPRMRERDRASGPTEAARPLPDSPRPAPFTALTPQRSAP